MLQKVEKSLLKLLPKWAKIHQNIAPEATFGHWFCEFGRFGPMPKQHAFFVPLLRLKKMEKLAQDAEKNCPGDSEAAPGIQFLGILAPGRPRARSQWKVLKF